MGRLNNEDQEGQPQKSNDVRIRSPFNASLYRYNPVSMCTPSYCGKFRYFGMTMCKLGLYSSLLSPIATVYTYY